MIQEEIEEKIINLAITSSKLSVRSLIAGLKAYVAYEKNKEKGSKDLRIKGKQTVKQLVGQNQGVTSIPVTDARIKEFDHIAKKYGVDYAVIKDNSEQDAKHTVFFKARDADVLEEIVKEYTHTSVPEKSIKQQVKSQERMKEALKSPAKKAEVLKQPVNIPEIRERSR